MYPKSLRSANTRSRKSTTTNDNNNNNGHNMMATTTTNTTVKIEDQGQPIHWIPIKEEPQEEEENSSFPRTPIKPTKRVSFDLIPLYINGDESQQHTTRASPSMSTKHGKENITPFYELLGRKKRSSSPTTTSTVKGAGIVKNTRSRRHHHHHHRHHHSRRQHRLGQYDNTHNNSNSNNITNSRHPRLILRGPREPQYRLVNIKFEGRLIRTVNMEIPTC